MKKKKITQILIKKTTLIVANKLNFQNLNYKKEKFFFEYLPFSFKNEISIKFLKLKKNIENLVLK